MSAVGGTAPPVRWPGVRATLRLRATLLVGGLVVTSGLGLLLLAVLLVRQGFVVAVPQGTFRDSFGRLIQAPLPGSEAVVEFQRQVQQQTVERLLTRGLLALAIVGVLGLLAAYAVAGRVLQPIQSITATARRLSMETLDERIALPGPHDELKELADTFDAMLGRLQESFDAQKRFVANASHELRTPLAVMRTEVDVALADPDAGVADLRAMGEVVRDATERADRLLDSLLLLARSDRLTADGFDVLERVALPTVLAAACSAVAREARSRGLRLDAAYLPVAVDGDPALLERLAGNLVENAVRHNVEGGWVRVGTTPVGDRARLVVSSSGLPVDPAEVDGLFQPFRRAGAVRTARRGAGLGLALVRAIAAAHGGTAVARALPEGGLEVTVDLPAAAAPPGLTSP